MNRDQFIHLADPMIAALDSAMDLMFGSNPTYAENQAQLEQAEDNFLARKEMEARMNETFLGDGI